MAYPPGVRFVPKDEELIMDYLKKKIDDEPLPMDEIVVVDLYAFSPDLLADKYRELGEREWYFFTPRNKKYPNGSRPNRCISSEEEEGFWKATGADTKIYSSNDDDDDDDDDDDENQKKIVIGFKKSLVFYKGKPPHGQKTNWLMNEYKLNQPSPRNNNNNKRDASGNMKLDDYVLCRLYKKRSSWKAEEQQKQQADDSFLDHATDNNAAAIVHYDDDFPLPLDHHINIGGGGMQMQQQQEQVATNGGDYSVHSYDDLFLVPDEPQPLLLDHDINGGATSAINGDSSDYSYDEFIKSLNFLVPDEPELFLDIDDSITPKLPLPNYNQQQQQEQAAADHQLLPMENYYYGHMMQPTKRRHLC